MKLAGQDMRSMASLHRIQKLKETHLQNPHYTQKELMMTCFESKYMVEKYYKTHVVGKIAIIKTG